MLGLTISLYKKQKPLRTNPKGQLHKAKETLADGELLAKLPKHEVDRVRVECYLLNALRHPDGKDDGALVLRLDGDAVRTPRSSGDLPWSDPLNGGYFLCNLDNPLGCLGNGRMCCGNLTARNMTFAAHFALRGVISEMCE